MIKAARQAYALIGILMRRGRRSIFGMIGHRCARRARLMATQIRPISVAEGALKGEMDDHLGYEKNGAFAGRGG